MNFGKMTQTANFISIISSWFTTSKYERFFKRMKRGHKGKNQNVRLCIQADRPKPSRWRQHGRLTLNRLRQHQNGHQIGQKCFLAQKDSTENLFLQIDVLNVTNQRQKVTRYNTVHVRTRQMFNLAAQSNWCGVGLSTGYQGPGKARRLSWAPRWPYVNAIYRVGVFLA